jgi:GT2 family glycosyltransferase
VIAHGQLPIAVVICTKDRAAALHRCLEAVLRGTMRPAEIIVIDQGAGGVDPALRQMFAEHNVAFQHMRMPGGGVSRGRNCRASLSVAELIAFTDDDCVPEQGWLAELYAACLPGIAGASGRVLPLPDLRPNMAAVSSRRSTVMRRYQGVAPHAPWDVGTGGNLLLRRGVFEQLHGFDQCLGPGAVGRAAEDIDLLYRVLRAGWAMTYTPAAVVYHEMKTRRARLRGRFPYAYGMGAFLVKQIRRGDGRGWTLLRQYMAIQILNLLGGLKRRNRWQIAEAIASIGGGIWGCASRLRPPAPG